MGKEGKLITIQYDGKEGSKRNNKDRKQEVKSVASSQLITNDERISIMKISDDDESNVMLKPGTNGEEDKKEALLVIEPAVSGRASCRGCKEKILKGEYRVGMKIWSSGRQIMTWHRPNCFLRHSVRVEKLTKNS